MAVEDGSLGRRNVVWSFWGGRLRWDVGVLDKFCEPVKLLEFRWKEGVEMEEALRQMSFAQRFYWHYMLGKEK